MDNKAPRLLAGIGFSLMAAVCQAQTVAIQAQAINLPDSAPGQDLWQYRYTVSGYSFPAGHGFDVYFDRVAGFQPGDIQAAPASPNADWNIATFQPDPNIPAGGVYDALALTADASLADPFVVDFIWRGEGTPGSQRFEIFNDTFQVIENGLTSLATTSNINTAQPFFLASGLGTTVNPAFEGGTLRVDAPGTYTPDFTINNQGGTLDANGLTSTFSGVFSDAVPSTPGALHIIDNAGGGEVILTGNNTYTGGTFVEQGTLAVNGSLVGLVDVSTGGTLRGTGTLNGPVNVSGTLAPGNSPGTLTANGTVTMNAGSVYQEDIDGKGTGNGAGNYSRLLVTGAGSQFVANGTLQPILRGITGNANNNFTPALGDTFRIVTATGGIVGRFSAVSQPSAGLAPGTELDPFYNINGNNSIDLIATPSSYVGYARGAGLNDNAQSAGGAVDRMRSLDYAGGASTRQNELRYAVAGLTAGQIPGALQGLSGEVHASLAAAAPETGRWLQSSLARQLSASPGSMDEKGLKAGDNIWMDFNASQGRADGTQSASGYTASRYQFAIGADILHSQTNRLGVGVTYASVNLSPGNGSGSIEDTAPFLYGQYSLGKTQKVIVDAMFAYGFSTWKTQRADPLQRGNTLDTNASAHNSSLGFGIRSPFAVGGFTIEPFARVLWQGSSRTAVNESPASLAALSLPGYGLNGTRLLFGASFGPDITDALATPFTYRASLAFGEDLGDLVRPTVQASLAGTPYAINSPNVSRAFGQLNVSGTYKVIENGYAYVGLNGEARENRLDGGINAGFNFKF